MQLALQAMFTDHDSTFASAFGKTYVSPETVPVPALPAPPPAFDRAHFLAFSVSGNCTSQSTLSFHPISNRTHDPAVSPLKPCFLDTPEQPVVPDIVHNSPIEPRPTKKLRTTETINNDDIWPCALWPQHELQPGNNTMCATRPTTGPEQLPTSRIAPHANSFAQNTAIPEQKPDFRHVMALRRSSGHQEK
jgi:hypothetical protein